MLPALSVLAFPVLYFAGNSGSQAYSAAGLFLLLFGLMTPLVKKLLRRR